MERAWRERAHLTPDGSRVTEGRMIHSPNVDPLPVVGEKAS